MKRKTTKKNLEEREKMANETEPGSTAPTEGDQNME